MIECRNFNELKVGDKVYIVFPNNKFNIMTHCRASYKGYKIVRICDLGREVLFVLDSVEFRHVILPKSVMSENNHCDKDDFYYFSERKLAHSLIIEDAQAILLNAKSIIEKYSDYEEFTNLF